MKLIDFHAYEPTTHPLTPKNPRGFTADVRGVKSIEARPEGVVVTFIPGDGDERTKDDPVRQILITPAGVGEIAAAPKGGKS